MSQPVADRPESVSLPIRSGGRIRPGWVLAICVWALYTIGMGIGWSVTDNLYEDSGEVLKDMWWVLLILVILMWVIVRLSGLKVQRSFRLGWLSLVLIVPVGLLLLLAIFTVSEEGTDWLTVLAVLGPPCWWGSARRPPSAASSSIRWRPAPP